MTQTYLPGDTRERIQDLIKDRKITQAELARKIGLSESSLSRFLSGKTRNLGDGYIIKIAKIFQVSADFLLGETDIPDRRNYDIEELGLSAKTAKLLFTGKVDAAILNQLVEDPRFPKLLRLLRCYRDETMTDGIEAINSVLTSYRSLLLGQAKDFPEDASAAKEAANVSLLCTPPVTIDTNSIQNLFMHIVYDLKRGKVPQVETQKPATADTLALFRQFSSKGEDSFNLRSITEEDLVSTIVQIMSVTDIPEEYLNSLSADLLKIFACLKVPKNDERTSLPVS